MMRRLDLSCALHLTQNDSTLIDAATAARLPVPTFSSGPTNSMRGAAYLGRLDSGPTGKTASSHDRKATLVVDIGGTSSGVGFLPPSGFRRQAVAYVRVAGVKVNYGMPHVESIGVGGGSIVRFDERGKATLGSSSVGHDLETKALVFA